MSFIKTSLFDKKELYGKKDVRELICAVMCFAAAFLFCGFSVGGGLSPFGVTFSVCLPYGYMFGGIPGCALGYAASLGTADMLRYWGAVALSSTLRAVFRRKLGENKSASLSPAFSAIGVLAGGALLLAFKGFSVEKILLLAGETAVSVCAGIIFRRSFFLVTVKSKADTVSVQDKTFLVCGTGLLMLCASGFTVMGISPSRVLSFMAVMLLASYKGAAFASAAGATVGVFLSVSPGFACLLPAMAVGGLASGLFSSYGQIISAAAYSLTTVTTALVQGKGEGIFVILAECLIAFAGFSLVPAELLGKVQEYLRRKGFVKDEKTGRMVAHDLKRASENVYSICDMINSVGESMRKQRVTDGRADADYDARADELQRVLTDQFRGIGDYLGELSLRVNETRIYDSSCSAAIKSALRESGIDVDMLGYFYGSNGSVTVEITLTDRPFDIDWKKAKTLLELMTRRRFEKPEVEVTELQTVLTFYQSLPYRIQIGVSKKSARDGEPCGDSVSAASSVDGRGFVLISDGMGTGYQAAEDSTLTSKIMKKLICGGFSFDSALKIVNSALIARSNQESVASIDAVEINLFTGEAVFYKAGAAQSIIRKKDRSVTLERSSMPLGILRNVRFSKTRFTGEAGDIILLLSDGVTQTDCGWINDELLSWSTNNMEELSMHILKLASLRADKQAADDMTVVAVKIEGNRG